MISRARAGDLALELCIVERTQVGMGDRMRAELPARGDELAHVRLGEASRLEIADLEVEDAGPATRC